MIGNLLSVFGTAVFMRSVSDASPGPVPSSFRYWRVIVDSFYHESYAGFAEIEMSDVLGGADLTLSGQSIYGTQHSTRPAIHAFDNTTSNSWASALGAAPTDLWIGQDFGTDVTISELRLTSRSDSAGAAYCPASFRLQGSPDGTAWSTVWTVDAEPPWNTSETRVYTGNKSGIVGIAARYWRVLVGAPYSGNITFSELVMAPYQFGPSAATAGQAIYGAETSNYPAIEAFDHSTAGYNGWEISTSTVAPSERWVGQDFGEPFLLSEIRIVARSDPFYLGAPTGFAVQYSSDNVIWQTAKTFSKLPAWSQGESRQFEIQLVPNPSPEVRLSKASKWAILTPEGTSLSKASKYIILETA